MIKYKVGELVAIAGLPAGTFLYGTVDGTDPLEPNTSRLYYVPRQENTLIILESEDFYNIGRTYRILQNSQIKMYLAIPEETHMRDTVEAFRLNVHAKRRELGIAKQAYDDARSAYRAVLDFEKERT